MTLYTYIPKLVKVLYVYDNWQWNQIVRNVRGERWIIGKYFVAEHNKTIGLKMGDAFIIEEDFKNTRSPTVGSD